jgi:hypothetical protein
MEVRQLFPVPFLAGAGQRIPAVVGVMPDLTLVARFLTMFPPIETLNIFHTAYSDQPLL